MSSERKKTFHACTLECFIAIGKRLRDDHGFHSVPSFRDYVEQPVPPGSYIT